MRGLTSRFYLRASHQRLMTAKFLLEHGYNLDAMYLAGYGIECGLKALLLERTARSKQQALVEREFRGRIGHDFERLQSILRKRGCVIPIRIRRLFRVVSSWSTDLRYKIGNVGVREATEFVRAAAEICDWCERSS